MKHEAHIVNVFPVLDYVKTGLHVGFSGIHAKMNHDP